MAVTAAPTELGSVLHKNAGSDIPESSTAKLQVCPGES